MFCFGLGYCARRICRDLAECGWTISATFRSDTGRCNLERSGYRAVHFDGTGPLPAGALDGVTHILSSIPPGKSGDPVLAQCSGQLREAAGSIAWAGYLSTTGVYGDRAGGWVDETSDLLPSTVRGTRRVDAERGWLSLLRSSGLPVHLFRLAGIYGPGRNQLESVRTGKARRIVKPGQVFSRIHVDDVAGILKASIARPDAGAAYNLCDDEAAPPQDVVAYAAELLGIELPPEIAFEDAEMSDMGRSFYAESKRVSNRKVKSELGYAFVYPNYRAGLQAMLTAQG